MTVKPVFEGDTREQIRQSVELLAGRADHQVAWLEQMGFDADELDLLFFEAVPSALPMLLREGKTTAAVDEALKDLWKALNALFARRDVTLMADESVASAPEWAERRNQSAQLGRRNRPVAMQRPVRTLRGRGRGDGPRGLIPGEWERRRCDRRLEIARRLRERSSGSSVS